MFSVGIVVPGWHYWTNPCRIQPLYEMYFATIIEDRFQKKNVKVSIEDLRGIRQDQQIYHIPEHDLYLYWIAKTGDYSRIQQLVRELRRTYPEAKHAAGGTHIDIFPEASGRDFDSIVVGPGEESFAAIVNDCLRGKPAPIYKSRYEDIHYRDYPYPQRHFLPETAVVNTLLFEKYGPDIRSTCVLFSRGCCFKCRFCVYNVPSTIQYRTIRSISDEIEYLKKEYRVAAVNLKDEFCIPLTSDMASEILPAIGRHKLQWRGQTTVIGITEEKIALAKQSGCLELALGVESVSQKVLDIVNKKITLEHVRQCMRLCRQYDIKIKMCLVFGLPGEPENILPLTLDFIEETRPDYVSVSGLDPVPGSDIFNHYRDYGIKYIDQNWEKHAHLIFRFSDYEEVGVPFEYEPVNRWGKTLSRRQILDNIRSLQHFLREHKMTY